MADAGSVAPLARLGATDAELGAAGASDAELGAAGASDAEPGAAGSRRRQARPLPAGGGTPRMVTWRRAGLLRLSRRARSPDVEQAS